MITPVSEQGVLTHLVVESTAELGSLLTKTLNPSPRAQFATATGALTLNPQLVPELLRGHSRLLGLLGGVLCGIVQSLERNINLAKP